MRILLLLISLVSLLSAKKCFMVELDDEIESVTMTCPTEPVEVGEYVEVEIKSSGIENPRYELTSADEDVATIINSFYVMGMSEGTSRVTLFEKVSSEHDVCDFVVIPATE